MNFIKNKKIKTTIIASAALLIVCLTAGLIINFTDPSLFHFKSAKKPPTPNLHKITQDDVKKTAKDFFSKEINDKFDYEDNTFSVKNFSEVSITDEDASNPSTVFNAQYSGDVSPNIIPLISKVYITLEIDSNNCKVVSNWTNSIYVNNKTAQDKALAYAKSNNSFEYLLENYTVNDIQISSVKQSTDKDSYDVSINGNCSTTIANINTVSLELTVKKDSEIDVVKDWVSVFPFSKEDARSEALYYAKNIDNSFTVNKIKYSVGFQTIISCIKDGTDKYYVTLFGFVQNGDLKHKIVFLDIYLNKSKITSTYKEWGPENNAYYFKCKKII